ncbi:family 78 glycoside hydrolase catalytic domain [Spirosoma soli]|uniref:alpha-L-rhamnosidase n=1 Tax=Spirosoma soli TaxID=1770529 RepID=A0ABW5M6S1_9BACT
MRLLSILVTLTAFAAASTAQSVTPTTLRCEYVRNPLGIETQKPRLSWQLTSPQRNQVQTAYRVLVADSPESLQKEQGNLWDSGKQMSDQSLLVPYAGKPLTATRQYFWKVQVWDKAGKPSAWSSVAHWRMGLPTKADWGKAQWIALEKMDSAKRIVPAVEFGNTLESQHSRPDLVTAKNALPQFRKEVNIQKPIKNATAFVSGLGHFDLFLNGSKVGDHVLDPGWTDYNQVAQYVTFDITKQLKTGPNAFGVMLGNGFFNIPNERYKKLIVSYGYPMFIAHILLEYTDGTTQTVVSDPTWKATKSPITFSSVFGGEDYNATLEQNGWMNPGFNDRQWQTPVVVQGPPRLSAQEQEPIKIFETFTAGRPKSPKKGVWIYDIGQNMSGLPQLTVTGKRGASVKLTPAELLTDSSLADQRAVGPVVFFTYTLRGSTSETWHPQFTYYGFRYVQVEGAVPAGEPNPDNLPVIQEIKGLHTRNAAPRVGSFVSSSQLFNRIDTLIDWGIRSNLASVLTDCPHREKLGWLEQTHLMGGSVRYTYDIARFYRKTIHDMQQGQTPDGLIPSVVPEYPRFGGGFRDSPEWGSAAVILPWYLYQWYGDWQLLTESYPMMQKYVGYLGKKAKGNILTHGLGDWYDLGPKDPGPSQLTPRGLTATATYYYDLTIMAQTAKLLGKTDEAAQYEQLASSVKQSFNQKYYDPKTAQYGTGSQTANAMALYMNLVEPENRAAVSANLIKEIKDRNNSLTAGDVGYRYLLLSLGQAGASDVIFDMNSRTDVPGYGYQLAKGATALTESWQANTNASNNHLMLGHLMEWFYSELGGIQEAPQAIAGKEWVIYPKLVGDIKDVNTSYDSPYGRVGSQWKKAASHIDLTVDVPVNTTATVYVPADNASSVTESGKPVAQAKDVQFVRQEKGYAVYKVGSGKYTFQSTGSVHPKQ